MRRRSHVKGEPTRYWSNLAQFTTLALLPVAGCFLMLLASGVGGRGGYVLEVCGGMLVLALPVGKFMFFPTTMLEQMYRGWVLRRTGFHRDGDA